MAEITKLGRYQLKRVLGKGAMGVVYEGFDPALNRHVAVKTILKSVAIDADTSASYSARFVREAQAVARLNHPHIVQVHDFGEQDEVAYLVMEFIEGRELRALFDAREEFAPAEAVRIMGELLDALDFAHERGVIHRDVKPANVMLDAQRRVKLADFGVARIQDSDRSLAGTMVGTPAFMSPEQIRGGKVDGRTDIFSAGTILYQLLTGEQPFKGEGAWTVAKKIVEDDPPPPSSVSVSVSPALDAVVHKALAKEPAQRFGKAREFAAALRGALDDVTQAAPMRTPKPKLKPEARASEAEVEFWRSIQNSTDPEEFDTYLQEFPQGTYAQLARIKMVKLREPIEAARKAVQEKERQEAEARARREAEEQARREAEEKARREAEEKVRREAEEKARRETEERARQAQALARLKQQEEAAARAKAKVDEDAIVAIGGGKAASAPTATGGRPSYAIPVVAAAIVIAGAVGAYLVLGRKPAPVPVAEAPAPVPAAAPKAEITAIDIEKIKRDAEERIRREYADKSAAEQAAAAKAASEKAAQEKQATLKAAAEKAAAEKAAADKLAADKAQAEKLAAAKAASERAALEKAAAEKAAAEKLAAEKAEAERLAAEKAAAERATAEKAAAAKAAAVAARPGWPSAGDRWRYRRREIDGSVTRPWIEGNWVVIKEVKGNVIVETQVARDGKPMQPQREPGAAIVSIANRNYILSPYLHVQQAIKIGDAWSNLPFKPRGGCTTNDFSNRCEFNARVAGREKVTVSAGTFDAYRVDVRHYVSGPGLSIIRDGVFWYSPEAKRYVKLTWRTISGNWTGPDTEVELLSIDVK